MIMRILKWLVPYSIRVFLKNTYILAFDFGQMRTARQWSSTDKQGRPIPWYTYPAIEYINQLDFTDKNIFEFGSGNSTQYWAQRCRWLTSVEDNEKWHVKIGSKLPSNVNYKFLHDRDKYVKSIHDGNEMFDVVIIDGSYRLECAAEAINRITTNAMIVLDNSDWYAEAAKLLREADLIQVDMAGFGPINSYTWTTSLFLTRTFRFRPSGAKQPIYGIGSKHHSPAH